MSHRISLDYLSHAQKNFLKEEQVDDFIDACSRPLRKSIRVNTLKISVAEFLRHTENYAFKLINIPWCKEGFWVETISNHCNTRSDSDLATANKLLKTEPQLGNLPEHLQGLFYIQEASSMLPPTALLTDLLKEEKKPNRNTMILDLAAAPGSKTTQLAGLLGNSGLILANEVSASRVKVLHSNLVRCGVTNVCMSQFDGRKLGQRLSSLFDYVLLDAPCSGEGTVRKDANALKDWQLESVLSIAKLQKELIVNAYRCLKPGGKLVYSTCTLSPEENQHVAMYLLEETDAETVSLKELFYGAEKSLTPDGFLHVLPHIYDSEGFFIAAFLKPMTTKEEYYLHSDNSKMTANSFDVIDKKIADRINRYYLSHFGIQIEASGTQLKQRQKEIWLFPESHQDINRVVRLNRSGIKLAEVYPNKIRSTHEFVSCFYQLTTRQKITLNLEQAEEFYKGRNIELTNHSLKDGEVILIYNKHAVGLGTLSKNRLKNQLPRDLVKDQACFTEL